VAFFRIITPLKRFQIRLSFALVALPLLASPNLAWAQPTNASALLEQARQAFATNEHAAAVSLASQAIAVEPSNPRSYLFRAQIHEEQRALTNALADYDAVIKLNAQLPEAWQNRGSTHFKLGRIKESIADFDQFLRLVPQQEPQHWQRGIAYYYAGRFEAGRKQFELHQTVNPNDVENAVWHFLCVARASTLEKARAALISITGDARVPMMEVHALFAGKLKPEDVLKAATSDSPSPSRLNRQLFYAHLYLGLYFEALGDDGKAREHITKAAGEYQTGDYMGDVARVHLQLRWPK